MAGGHAWQGACVVGGMHGGGVWWGVHGRGHAMAGGVCGGGNAWQGGVHGRGHASHTPPWQILRDTVNEWAVRILLECILVNFYKYPKHWNVNVFITNIAINIGLIYQNIHRDTL